MKRMLTQLDLDSICCALVYAYVRSSTPPYVSHIPLSNIPASDLSLRPELRPVLSKANLKPSDLITLTDVPTSSLSKDKIFLVDHNVLTGPFSKVPSSQVAGCIDHHNDEVSVSRAADVRIVENSGSCMSLVIAQCRQVWQGICHAEEDAGLAQVALAPILVDTNCLKDASKTKEVDRESVKFLESLLKGQDYDREAYFNEVTKAKQDIESLSLHDILRKDYKTWQEDGMKLGMSSVVKDISFLKTKADGADGLSKSTKDFAAERELSIFAIMTTSTLEGAFRRELLVSAFHPKAKEALQRFANEEGTTLGLKTWRQGELDKSSDDGAYCRCWIQEGVQYSRKQLGPMLRKSMQG